MENMQMKQAFIKNRVYFAALLAILLSLCFALGLGYALPRAVYADDGEEIVPKENHWITQSAFLLFVEAEDRVIEIKEWEQGKFHGGEYVVSAEAEYGNEKLYFRIYESGENGLSAIGFEKSVPVNGEMDKEAFRTEENGLVLSYVSDKLVSLKAGTYYLLAVVEDEYGEYTGLNNGYLTDEEIIKRSFEFRVTEPAQKEESTLTGLTIDEWTLGNYENAHNLIKAETNVGLENVTYAVYYDNDGVKGSAVINLASFNTDANGAVVDIYTIDSLGKLGAGKYWLVAYIIDNDGEYLSVMTPFHLRRQNYWVVIPSLTSWNEGHYNVKDNVLNGAANKGNVKFTILDDKDNVLYTVVKDDESTVTSVINANGDVLHVSALNKLAVGSYKIIAEVESTDKYSSLRTTAYFAVFEDSVALSGIIAATVTFAVIDLIAAGLCIALLIIRRRRISDRFRKMVSKELHRG